MREYIGLTSLLKMTTGHSEAKFEPVRVSDLVSVSHSNIWLAPREGHKHVPFETRAGIPIDDLGTGALVKVCYILSGSRNSS